MTMTITPISLERLLRPLPVEEFFSRFWEKRHLHVVGGNRDGFQQLLADVSIPREILRNQGAWKNISLARSLTSPAECIYLQQPLSEAAVGAALAERYTLVINDMQNTGVAIASACRQLERAFAARCNANLYLTPPNCQGLDAHYDDQDVLVLQLQGSKVWHLYDKCGRQLPLDDEEYRPPSIDGVAPMAVRLQPGDVLYVPRGLVHDAHTEAETSLHVTIAVSSVRWATYLQRLIREVAQDQPLLRQAVPPAILRDGHAPGAERLLELLQLVRFAVAGTGHSGDAMRKLYAGFIESLVPMPGIDSVPGPSRAITSTTRLRIADGQIWSVQATADLVTLRFVGATLSLPPSCEPLLRQILRDTPFTIDELASDAPSEARDWLIRELCNIGFLVCDTDSPPLGSPLCVELEATTCE